MTAPAWIDRALGRLLSTTLSKENSTALRDAEILAIQRKYAPEIARAQALESSLSSEIEVFYRANRAELEADGKKCVQMAYGLVGLRAAANPALVPLDESWSWEKIEVALKAIWKNRYFHKPKPPGIDKNKIKKSLSADELSLVGLKLDDSESFYIELNRLAPADESRAA